MNKSGFAIIEQEKILLKTELDNEFVKYLNDLIEYGLTRYFSENGDNSDFRQGKL